MLKRNFFSRGGMRKCQFVRVQVEEGGNVVVVVVGFGTSILILVAHFSSSTSFAATAKLHGTVPVERIPNDAAPHRRAMDAELVRPSRERSEFQRDDVVVITIFVFTFATVVIVIAVTVPPFRRFLDVVLLYSFSCSHVICLRALLLFPADLHFVSRKGLRRRQLW